MVHRQLGTPGDEIANRPAATRSRGRWPLAKWLLAALLFAVPLMKPNVAGPVVLVDVIFLALVLAVAVAAIADGRLLQWRPFYWMPVAYAACLACSILVSPDPARSAFKLSTVLYLVGLALLTDALIDSERDLRRLVLAWLAGTAAVVAVGLLALIIYPFAPESLVVRYSRFHFGTLPPGDYPRIAATFFNANMLCNYLAVSAGVLLVAVRQDWLNRRGGAAMLAAILVVALFTLSPGLGGVALSLSLWLWVLAGPRLARVGLWAGGVIAVLFLVAATLTPIMHPTAPFSIGLPWSDAVVAPSGRLMVWLAAVQEFMRYPLLGHGLGIDAVKVRYLSPSGDLQLLTDAHNVVLSIAAQCGIVGVVGLGLLLGHAARLGRHSRRSTLGPAAVVLSLTFLNGLLYQGLTGSFEDTRHLWLLLGLLMASARLAALDVPSLSRPAPAS